jgi:hypothetical protein
MRIFDADVTGSLHVSGSSELKGNLVVSGSQTITGSLTVDGNTKFGDQLSDNHNFTGSVNISGSHTLTGSLNLLGNQFVSGSVYILNDLIVHGTSSVLYLTTSQLAVSESYISVNVFEPLERFGGIKVYDSGSSNATASLTWDSQKNHWVYTNTVDATYSGGMLISGPRNTGSLGDEVGTINNRVTKGQGGDHITSSNITDTGTIVSINSNSEITGSLIVTNGLSGSLDYSYLINVPTLVSGSSQISYSGLTGIPSNIISGSAQIYSLGFLTGYTDTNTFTTGATFNTGDGVITFTKNDGGTYTVDIDGRFQPAGSYLTGYTETDTFDNVTDRGSVTTNTIEVGGLTTNGDIQFGPVADNNVNYSIKSGGQINIHSNNQGTADQFFSNLVLKAGDGSTQSVFNIGGSNASTPNQGLWYTFGGSEYFRLSNNGTTRFNAYSTNGFVKFINSDGTLGVDTNTYLTSTSLNGYATTGYVQTQITNLIDSSPSTLDTLNELAAALGDDPNFATTVATSIGNKVSKSGDTMTGNLSIFKNNTTLTLGQINVSTGFTTIEMYAGGGGAFNGYAIRYNKDTSFDRLEFVDGGGMATVYFENGGFVNANQFRKIGGTSSQFLKADGSVDSSTYLTAHPSVSAASSSNNSGRTYIQDILLDSFGHITGITTATETVTDTNTFITGATFNTSDGVVTITKNDGNTVTVDLDGRYQLSGSYLTGYTETDTLATVTARGNTTNQAITVSGVTSYNDVVISGGTLTVYESVSGATVFAVDGTNGRLFAVTDDLSNSLFSVSTISGLPVIEAFADYRIVMGRFNQNDFYLGTTGEIGMGSLPVSGFKLAVTGNVRATSFVKSGGTSSQFLKADGSVDSNTYLTAHPSVSAASSSNNSGRTYIQDILLDSFGHITGITTASETVTDTFTTGATFNTGNGVITFTNNNGGGTFTVDIDGRFLTSYSEISTLEDVVQRGDTTTLSITAASFITQGGNSGQFVKGDGSLDSNTYLTAHPSVSAAGSSNNSGRTYIQDILLDSFGHITGITTATETVTDTNNYTTGATFNTGNGVVTFTRNDGVTYTVDLDGRYLESYSETDTLATVTSRGASTTTAVSFNGGLTTTGLTNNSNAILANNTGINPNSFSNRVVAGGISDGGWGVTTGIAGNAGTNHNWSMGHNGSNFYFGISNGSSTSLSTWMQVSPSRVITLNGYTSNGFLKTSSSDGTLTVDTTSYYPSSNPSGYISSYLNYFTTGATFNTSNGIITFSRNDGNTYTVDIDGKYSELGHTHDDRYLPYVKNVETLGLVSGRWYTIAVNVGNRAVGKFILRDTSSGNHQSVVFYATHHFGSYSDITVLINSRYSGNPFRYIRIQDGGTYDGALLQVYIDQSSSTVQAWMLENIQSSGWVIKDWVDEAVDPGDVTNFPALIETPAQVDLDQTPQGGLIVTGPIYGGGDTTQYEYLNTNNYSTTTDTRYYTETEIANFFGGSVAITGYNKSNWDTAYGWGNHGTQGYATTGYVQTQITNLIDGAPAALDTLNELAAALGDDPNFATTFAGAIGAKLPLSGGTMTGNIAFGATSNLGLTWGLNTDAAFIKFISTSNAAGGSYLEIGTQDDSDEEIKFTQSGNVRFYLATDGFLRNGAGYKYVFENGTWAIDISGNAATVTNGVYTNGSYSNPSWITALAGSKITGNISGNASNITSYTINQDLGTSNSPTFNNVTATGVYGTNSSSTRNKYNVYSNSGTYAIGMESGANFGGLADWAMTFQMNNDDDRGFWWGDDGHNTSQGAMALTTNGYLTVARGFRVGYGESDTTTPSVPLQVYGSGSLVFDVQGSQGQLFSVTDSLSGSLFSVNDISGLPILEVFSDDKLVAGSFGTNAFVVSGTTTTVSGSLAVSGSATVNGGTVWHSGNDGSGSGLDADTLDGLHASSFLTGHPSVSAASSVNNSGRTYIQDITLDSNGHVTGLVSATETVTDTNYYLTSASFNTGNGVLTLGVTGYGNVTVDLDGRYLESYTETDTLASVTARGATTSTAVTFSGGFNDGYITFNAAQINRSGGYVELQYSSGGGVRMFGAGATPITFNTGGDGTFSSSVTASSFVKSGGSSSQYLMADGSVSTNPGWITSYSETDTLNSVTTRGASTTNDITIGGLTVGGSLTYGSFSAASNYVLGADNIVLKGNSGGVSGIFFESEKNGTNINHPSDFGFIQYHAYGVGGSSGEANRLVIGVSNDADDIIVLNPVNTNGLVVRVGAGTTEYTVYHAGNIPTWNQNTTGNASTATYATTAGALTSMNISQFTNNSGYLTAHPTISAASSVNNSGRTYIQDITLDSNGHITGIVSATETVTDTDTNYYVTGATFNTSTGVITMTRNDGGTVTVDIDGKYQEAGTYLGAISYNNDSNSNYQLLWGSGNAVYGTAGVYVNPSSDYVYATSFNASDWFRSSGNTGWYNSTYDGGIYMTESTSVRVYNNKGFWIDGGNGNSVNDATLYVTATNNNDWLAQFNAYNSSKSEYGIYVNIAAAATYGYALRTDSSSFTYRVDGSGRVYAPIYYDINDTNYYVNPASTSNLATVKLNSTASGTEVFTIDGVNGRLFTITDDLSNSLFSVNTIAGVPVVEVFADNKVIMGRYNQNDLHISSTGEIGMGNTSVSGYKLAVTGNLRATSFVKTGGSSSQFLMADGSVSTNPGWITSYTDTNYYLTSASFNTGNGVLTLGVTGYGNVTVDLDGRYLESYSETDTLDSVLSRGASTTRTAEFYQTSNTFVNTVAAANRGLTVYQNTAGADAYMTFHISGDYAGYFGLGGAENDLVWGGWSVGNVRYRIWHSGNDGSGSGLDADTLDGQHASAFLTGHPSVSAAGSSNNSGRTYIQDILLDSFGHITGITTATETVVDTDTNYYTTSASFNTSNGVITFSRNDGGTYTVDIDGKYAESSHTHDDRYYTESESDGRFQPLENQRVSTGNTVRFSNTYTTAWFRNDNSNTGLYNETTTQHLSSNANGYWDMSSTTSFSGIRFYTGGHVSALRGYLYANTSNEIGFLNSGGNWSLRCDNSQNVHVTTAVYAPIYYDSANSNYYLNPNGYSNLGTVRFNSSGANAEVVAVDGVNGRLFTVTDDMTDSIFSVNTISGLPVIEAFADYKVVMGRYAQNDFIINSSGQVSIGAAAQGSYKFTVIGGQWGSYFRGGDSGTGSDIARFVDNGGNTKLLVRGDGNSYFYGSVYINDNIIWHAGNDGSGSGLDADLLDGNHASYFINTSNIGSQSVNYASSAGNADTVDSLHASDFVRAYTTSAGNIDSDWGQSFKTFDPIPSGTPPLSSPNIRTINIGENFSRRTQLAFDYASDLAYFRRRNDSGWQTWREFIHSGNIGSFAWTASNDGASSGLDADLLDGQHGSYYATASSLGSYLPLAGGTLTGDLLSTHPFYPGYNNGGVASQGSYYLYGNSTNSGLRTNGNFLVNGDIYWGNQSVWLSDWLNQNVKTNASPTFVDIYANNWFRNNQVNEGLYNEATNNHWYSENNGSWTVGSTNASYGEIRMRLSHQGTYKGSFYWDAAGIGILNEIGGWGVRVNYGGSYGGTIYGSWNTTGHFLPTTNNAYDLGSPSLGWRNIYTNDLHLSNMNKPEGNDIDGTSGTWTIQEGAENLYIINNLNGKKYRITLEEI